MILNQKVVKYLVRRAILRKVVKMIEIYGFYEILENFQLFCKNHETRKWKKKFNQKCIFVTFGNVTYAPALGVVTLPGCVTWREKLDFHEISWNFINFTKIS